MQPQLIVKELMPPLLWKSLKSMKRSLKGLKNRYGPSSSTQDLSPYWESKMAEILETWGDGNVWNEIQMFFLETEGKVLDVACGTGKTSELLSSLNPSLDRYGCDLSD